MSWRRYADWTKRRFLSNLRIDSMTFWWLIFPSKNLRLTIIYQIQKLWFWHKFYPSIRGWWWVEQRYTKQPWLHPFAHVLTVRQCINARGAPFLCKLGRHFAAIMCVLVFAIEGHTWLKWRGVLIRCTFTIRHLRSMIGAGCPMKRRCTTSVKLGESWWKWKWNWKLCCEKVFCVPIYIHTIV